MKDKFPVALVKNLLRGAAFAAGYWGVKWIICEHIARRKDPSREPFVRIEFGGRNDGSNGCQ